jgi:hypothetical protein
MSLRVCQELFLVFLNFFAKNRYFKPAEGKHTVITDSINPLKIEQW